MATSSHASRVLMSIIIPEGCVPNELAVLSLWPEYEGLGCRCSAALEDVPTLDFDT